MDAVDLIAQAIKELDYRPPEGWRVAPDYSDGERLLIGALEAFYGNASADEQAGETDSTGHIFRVDRWTLFTDSAGFIDVTEHSTIDEAGKAVAEVDIGRRRCLSYSE